MKMCVEELKGLCEHNLLELRWFEHIERRDERPLPRTVFMAEVSGGARGVDRG